MRLLYVPLPAEAREALVALADNEMRRPQEMAAVLVMAGLREAGALKDERPGR
jgi:hypothetical protein